MEPIQSSEPSPNDCPRAYRCVPKTVPRIPGTSNKSLDSYSLTVMPRGGQWLAPNGHNRGLNGNPGQPTVILRVPKRGLLVVRMGWNFPLLGKIPAYSLPKLSYSLRVGRRTAMTKCAKFEAPSSSCSQRTTQCSPRYFATRVSGIPRYCASCGLIESAPRRLEPPRNKLPMAMRSVWQAST